MSNANIPRRFRIYVPDIRPQAGPGSGGAVVAGFAVVKPGCLCVRVNVQPAFTAVADPSSWNVTVHAAGLVRGTFAPSPTR